MSWAMSFSVSLDSLWAFVSELGGAGWQKGQADAVPWFCSLLKWPASDLQGTSLTPVCRSGGGHVPTLSP